ncbi:hypothetical protein CesoFtcFv8_016947 [Champsocephalus esox]|uniref:Uncharacterized protein n=1 Tax=Champsocephalus esox TaxID=159716 RepID=A0AAN8BII7_9TELE|nr:hypothetical protein CesoFtcFv8_016947 [Champsocephalus esox]
MVVAPPRSVSERGVGKGRGKPGGALYSCRGWNNRWRATIRLRGPEGPHNTDISGDVFLHGEGEEVGCWELMREGGGSHLLDDMWMGGGLDMLSNTHTLFAELDAANRDI